MTWLEVSLEQICEVDWGNTKLTKSSYVTDGKFLAVSAAGADGLIDYYEHEANVPVLSAIGAQCGRMFYPGERFTAIKNTITLTPKDNMANGKFLYYLFTSVALPRRGAGQPFISKGDIESFRVLIPESLEEQREIVEKLDKAFAEIDLLEENLELCNEKASQLLQSLLSSSFSHSSANDKVGLKVVLLKDICLEVPRIDPKLLGRETFKYLDIGSLSSNSRSIGDVGSVSVVDAPGRARQLLSKNDSVFSTVRPYMKKIAFIDQSLDNEIASTGFCVLRPDSKLVDPRFLYHYLYSDLLLDQVLPLQTGVSYPAIRDNDLKGASISLPPLEKQREIVEKLDIAFGEIEKIRNRIAIKRDFVSILKQSLLSDAFPSDEKRVSA
jgi:type I restriction enzyme S subunit